MILAIVLSIPPLTLLALTLWNVVCWPKVSSAGRDFDHGSVSILIPARDEASNIADCLDRVLAQGHVVREILVYDDHSADETGKIVTGYRQRDQRVALLTPEELPAGWCGKPFACAQLAASASGTWLLFLDADARLHVDAIVNALRAAESSCVTLLSCWPELELITFWERALMPLLNFVVFTFYPAPLAMSRSDAALGLAHGSFMLAHRDTYLRIGGHRLVRAEIFEDTRLAQLWRARGESSLCLDGRNVLYVRMYDSFGKIWRGFQKNFFPAFRRSSNFVAFLGLHFIIFWLPFLLAPFAIYSVWARPFATAAICVLMMRAALALRFGHPLWSVLLHPFCEAVLIVLGVSSWLQCRSGRGVEWKGRRYRAGVRA
jgi:glycosyltransferase involved in cell wall biosynthesis